MARKKRKQSNRQRRRVLIRDYLQVKFDRQEQACQAPLVNISLEGLCCLFSFEPKEGEHFQFRLEKGDRSLSLTAQTRWIQKTEQDRYRVGFKIIEKDPMEMESFLKEMIPPSMVQDSLKKNAVHYNSQPDEIALTYGPDSIYEGKLVSIDQQEICFRGHFNNPILNADVMPNCRLAVNVPLSNGELSAQIILKQLEKEDTNFKFTGEFQNLTEGQLNLIRHFLVDHYLHCD